MNRPCLVAGCPSPAHRQGPRCQLHQRIHDAERNHRRTQYTGPWKTTSRRARAEQPWCTRCGTPDDLTLDHETGTVECRPCNSAHRANH